MVSLEVDGMVLMKVVDPVRSVTRVQNVHYSIAQLVKTEMRNLLGTKNMSQILTAKQQLSLTLQVI